MRRVPSYVGCFAVCFVVLVCFLLWHHDRAIAAPANAADAVKAQDPRVWAGVSASVPNATTNAMFSVGEINRLMIGVALVNDGETPIPFDREKTRLVINGEAVEIFERNGPVWNEVQRGRPFGASTGGPAKYFSQPGLYKIQWIGDGFSSYVLEIRITAN